MTEPVNFKHISAHTGPEESPGYLLWRVSTRWRTAIEAVLKQFNLTHPQFVVLATTGWLTRDGASVTQVAIGRMAGLDPNTTSQVLRGLQAKKLIKRAQELDARSKQTALTDLGKERLSKALPAVEAADKQFFSSLEATKREAFIGGLQQLMYLGNLG